MLHGIDISNWQKGMSITESLDSELVATHSIKRNSDGTYTLTPVEG